MEILSPSLLSADFTQLGNQLSLLESVGVPYIHLDIMDGVFVPNITMGQPVLKSIRKATKLFFDVHLMIVEPEKYIQDFRDAGADSICFHVEATKNPAAVIKAIQESGAKAAISLKPATPIESLLPYINQVDMVLVMTVEPGFGGQSFRQEQLEKVKTLAKWKKEKNLSYDIQVDGGISMKNIREVLEAGANVIVAGSAVLGQPDVAKAAKDFLDVFQEARP